MNKQELVDWLNDKSLSAKEAKAKIDEFLDEQKAQLDTETRRKVRAFWIVVSIVAFIVGGLIGHFVW